MVTRLTLFLGPHLALITTSRLIGHGPSGEKIFNALDLEVIPVCSTSSRALTSREKRDEKKYIAMLRSVIRGHRNAFYFSLDFPLSVSAQRLAVGTTLEDGNPPPFWRKSDEQFFWNQRLLGDFIEKDLHEFVVPVINGFVKV